jgi:NAD-dependent DNA ligase
MIQRLMDYWVNFDPKKYTDTWSNTWEKWTFSITGTFDLPREEIVQIFEKQGYKFHEQPTKTTDFMLIGEKAWSKKAKAQEAWITIYEGRENIKNQFPFLKNLQPEKKSSPKINQSSLF